VRTKCYHPSGTFIPFSHAAIEQSIVQRFEQQVQLYPNRLALQYEGHTWTYTELEQYANRIAHAILAVDDTPQVPVALLFEQGAQVIAAMLGALKAGKIYVPLDPLSPPQRLTSMLYDATAALLITNSHNLALAGQLALPGMSRLNVDTLDSATPDSRPGIISQPDDYAYIIYTSGSTGQPKGVVERHRNLLHHTMNYTNPCGFCADDRLVQLLSYSFSGAVTPIYGALLNGAALLPYDVHRYGIALLARWLIDNDITVFIGGSLFRALVNSLHTTTTFPHLRLLYCGAEALYKHDVDLYRQHFAPHCVLVNSLGATEMKIFRQYFIDHTTPLDTGSVPVGYAVQDNEVYIVNDQGTPLGSGEIGEIVVKSPYMAAGYWRQPELTRARFRPDPAGSTARLYYTGDLGLMQPDGCLVHMGRRDFQIKIRGHRVEIGEVEAALLEVNNVKETVVIATQTAAKAPQLIGYVVVQTPPAPSVSQLRRSLAQTLPAYMIPSAFVVLDILPRLPTGKVDRAALPTPDAGRPDLDRPFVAPHTPIEVQLGRIWGGVLHLESVGIDDPFVELGGDSLLATQLLTRIIETFRVELPLRTLLETSTIADMALVIAQHQAKQLDADTITQLLAEVETLTEHDVQHSSADENSQAG
jgi:amino acid adenylation domain-containing protein